MEGQTKVLNEGNEAVSKECVRLEKLTATQHETHLQNIQLLEDLRTANLQEDYLSLQFEETNAAMIE